MLKNVISVITFFLSLLYNKLLQKHNMENPELVKVMEQIRLLHGSSKNIENLAESLLSRLGTIDSRLSSIDTRLATLELRATSTENRMSKIEHRIASMDGKLDSCLNPILIP